MATSRASCRLCEEDYNENEHLPKILCAGGHSYCKACIRKLFQANLAKDKVPCPECRREVGRPDNVDNLSTNFLFFDIGKPSNAKACCSIHADKTISFVCTDCMVYLCNTCVLQSEHRSHTCMEVDDAKEDFNSRSDHVSGVLERLAADVNKYEQMSQSLLSDTKSNVREEINRRFEQVITAAKRWRAETLTELDAVDIPDKFRVVKKRLSDTNKKHKNCTDHSHLQALHSVMKEVNAITEEVETQHGLNVVPTIQITGSTETKLGQLQLEGTSI